MVEWKTNWKELRRKWRWSTPQFAVPFPTHQSFSRPYWVWNSINPPEHTVTVQIWFGRSGVGSIFLISSLVMWIALNQTWSSKELDWAAESVSRPRLDECLTKDTHVYRDKNEFLGSYIIIHTRKILKRKARGNFCTPMSGSFLYMCHAHESPSIWVT